MSLSLVDYIQELREVGFRIGVVVDEAHLGFTRATEAVKFYRDVMRPDFTLLITATPDDQDVDTFKAATGIVDLHRVSVSRHDAVEASLIKDGIKSITYIAPDDQKTLLDFTLTSIVDAWQMHCAIKAKLVDSGIRLTPFMLVQVGNSDTAVDEAKSRLIEAGVPSGRIASYTSKDPSDDLLVVAKDETKEVLIFKVAVALGFDAPRAFTLVSLRGAKDTDFGIQVVRSLLRVHHRLQARVQNKTLPEILRYGYVFLAYAENQTGLTSAGDKINLIQTELSKVSPYTMIVSIAGRNEVQGSPLATGDLLKCIQRAIVIDDHVINAGRRKSIKITKTTVDIFDSEKGKELEKVQARLSNLEIARRAQGVLFDAKILHVPELHQTLIERLRREYDERGFDDSDEEIEVALNLILATFPSLVRKAARQCAANYKKVLDTFALPNAVEYPHGTLKSILNIYGVMPQDLNEHERKFAESLDADNSGTVEYWFRNEPRKPWSIGIVMPNGDRYFPDFGIKVKDRTKGDGIVLVEIKGNHILNSDNALDKVVTEHKTYGVLVMLVREDIGRFMIVRYNEKTDKNELYQIFRVENLG